MVLQRGPVLLSCPICPRATVGSFPGLIIVLVFMLVYRAYVLHGSFSGATATPTEEEDRAPRGREGTVSTARGGERPTTVHAPRPPHADAPAMRLLVLSPISSPVRVSRVRQMQAEYNKKIKQSVCNTQKVQKRVLAHMHLA